jgi:hypothetical protein
MNHDPCLARAAFLRTVSTRLLLVTFLLWLAVGAAPRPAAAQAPSVFPPAANVLAQFEFNGSADDSSGNNRDGELLGGTFVSTRCGSGLRIGEDTHGVDWSKFAAELIHPYTIEMILTPEQTSSYAKLFSSDASADAGWYYHSQGIRLYPNDWFGEGSVLEGEPHYLAFVSTAADTVDVYFQGVLLGSGDAGFTVPPTQAIFFKDDDATGNRESLRGVVDALRISSTARSANEIAAVQERVGNCEWEEMFLPILRH